MSGGNFWQGAIVGGVVAGLNHVMHNIAERSKLGQASVDLTKEFDKTLKNTRDDFAKRKKIYDEKYKSLLARNARPESFMAVAQEQLQEFYQLVKSGAIYDLKSNPESLFNKDRLTKNAVATTYKGEVFRHDDFGNYNFGVAAKAFVISLDFAQKGAGLYQVFSGQSKIRWISSYFDDPRDFNMIGRGYRHFK